MNTAARLRPPPIPQLTGIRFLAAFWVVLFHYGSTLGLPQWLYIHGRAGVSLFFVLSGFILSYNYGRQFEAGVKWANVKQFALARFARIYPLYVVTLCLMTVVVFALGEARPPTWTWPLHLLSLQAWVPSTVYDWNLPAWSISAEFFFYACFPLFTWLVLSWLRSSRQLLLLAALLYLAETILFLAGVAVIKRLDGQANLGVIAAWVYPVPLFRVWEFFIGCCVGTIFLNQWKPGSMIRNRGSRLLLVSIAALLAAAAASIKLRGMNVLGWYVLYTPIFAAIIFSIASGAAVASKLLSLRPMVLLGEASYALYLIHAMVLGLAMKVYAGRTVPISVSVATIVVSILLSVALYRIIEVPVRRWLRSGGTKAIQVITPMQAVAVEL